MPATARRSRYCSSWCPRSCWCPSRPDARKTGRSGLGVWWLLLWPAANGALGTYSGWLKVDGAIGSLPPTQRFSIYNAGMFEANASRFLGFWQAALLFVSLAALAGMSGTAAPSETLAQGVGVKRRESFAACAGLIVLAAVAVFMGAPSGALIAGVAAGALLVGVLLPAVHARTATRDELERASAGLLAVGLSIAVGFARLEAREAVLWHHEPTRAARAAEIVAAAGERTATIAIAIASLGVVLAIEATRLRRLWARGGVGRPRPGTVALAAVVLGMVVCDQVLHARFLANRDALRTVLDPQFSLFARLDPPPGDALDRERFAPRKAPALQIARDRVAINGEGVAKLGALDSPEVAVNVSGQLSRALAAPEAGEATEDGPDLSVSIDREVPYGSVLRLLQLARGAGVRRIELLLTRGPRPSIPPSAPPEAAYAVATDFVAVQVTLAADGLRPADEDAFGKVAPALVEKALTGAEVSLAVPAR